MTTFQNSHREDRWWFWEDDSNYYHFTRDSSFLPGVWKQWWQNYRGDISFTMARFDSTPDTGCVVCERVLRRDGVDNILSLFVQWNGKFKRVSELSFDCDSYRITDIDGDGISELWVDQEKGPSCWILFNGSLQECNGLVRSQLGFRSVSQFQKAHSIRSSGRIDGPTLSALRRELVRRKARHR